MINQIISFSIRNKLIIGIAMVFWVGLGIYSMKEVPIDAVPDITNNQVQIITVSPNLGTEDIEQFVTYQVELAMANLPDVTEIRSISRFGLSVVTVVFEDKAGTYLPRQLVGEKLNQIKSQIPEQFGEPFMGPISTGLGEIYQYVLEVDPEYEDRYSLTDLREIQDWIVKRQMAMVPGVVEVNSIGGDVKQYEIAIDPGRLKSMNVTMAEVFSALEKNNGSTGGAYIVKDRMANYIRGEGLIRSLEDIEDIVVKTKNHVPLLIKDVANVRFGKGIRYGAMTKDGKGEAVGGTVMLLKEGNSNEVINRVKNRVEEIQKSLPKGVYVRPFLDRSKLISNTTGTVRNNLLEGGLIVIFVLIIFLGNFRGGLIVASTIPLSLLFAFIMMNIFDVWSNLMSLGAIDFGIIVDGAVIIVESVVFMAHKRVRDKSVSQLSSEDLDQLSYKSSSKMMNAAFFGQLIILIVFLPILALTGVEGKMFKPMALTFSFAVVGAMILCLTYVPMASALFMNKKYGSKLSFGDRFIIWLTNKYDPLIKWILGKRALIVAIAVGFLVIAGVVFSRLGGEFIPQLDEGDIAFHAMLKPGSSLEEMTTTTTKIEEMLLDKFPEIEHIVSRIGVAEIPTDPMPMDIADMFAILKPPGEWTSGRSKAELIEEMKFLVSEVPGVNYEFTQPIEMRFNELLTGVREDVAIKIYGDDLDILAQKAEQASKLIAAIDGIGDMKAEATKGLAQMTVHYKRSRLAQYGLNVEDLNRTIRSAFSGEHAGIVFEGERQFDIVIRFSERNRKGIEDLRNLFVPVASGGQIPLREVAKIEYEPGPMQISREGTNRRIYVGVNVRGRDVESLINEVQDVLDAQLNLPPGYYIRYGGAFENLQRAKERLSLVVPLALALIFVLLFFALRSFVQTLMIYMSIPLAAIGGVLALWVRDMPFSIAAGVGFIVLFGVAVLNGLVLVSSFNDLKNDGSLSVRDRIILGTKERIRPIFLTASTDILGFLPMAISTSAGAEVQRPLATVVIGGLLTSSLLTLVVLPVLYHFLETRKNKTLGSRPVLPIAILLFLLSPSFSKAQADSVLSVEEAVDVAFLNNKKIQAGKVEVQQKEALVGGAFNLPKTSFGASYGQYDGFQNDLSFSVSQSFKFPGYYKHQSRLAQEEVDLTSIKWDGSANDLRRRVRELWHQIDYLNQKEKLLNEQDSVFKKFQRAALIRYETQASTLLEKTSVDAEVMELDVHLNEVRADITVALNELSLLLNQSVVNIASQDKIATRSIDIALDSSAIAANPQMRYMQQQLEVLKEEKELAKSNSYPDFKIGYTNQSLIGYHTYNGEERYADRSTRFSVLNAGISLPLWVKPFRANVKAKQFEMDFQSMQNEYYSDVLQSEIERAFQRIKKLEESMNYYRNMGLKQAELIIDNALRSYKIGAVDYLDFVSHLKQANTIKLQYLERVSQFNQEVIYIEYLTGK